MRLAIFFFIISGLSYFRSTEEFYSDCIHASQAVVHFYPLAMRLKLLPVMELDVYEIFVEEYHVVEVTYNSGFKADLLNLQSIKDLSGDFCMKEKVRVLR